MSEGHINGKHTPISKEGMESINAARYKIPITVTYPDGSTKDFPSMKSIEAELGYKPGSVSNFLKTGNPSKTGYRFAYKDGIKNLPKKQQKP